jgi:hypothetical protein
MPPPPLTNQHHQHTSSPPHTGSCWCASRTAPTHTAEHDCYQTVVAAPANGDPLRSGWHHTFNPIRVAPTVAYPADAFTVPLTCQREEGMTGATICSTVICPAREIATVRPRRAGPADVRRYWGRIRESVFEGGLEPPLTG